MSAVPDDIAADFIIEAQEILDRLGEQLVSLEHAPEDSEQLNAVFRGFHTLKGGAGFLAINAMVELCHAAEDTLGQARAGQATLQARHFDAAQQSLDYLQSMLDAFGSGSEPPRAPQQLIAQFATSGEETAVPSGPGTRDSGPGKSAAHAAASSADSELISDDEFEALLDNLHGAAPGAGAQLSRVLSPESRVPPAPKAAAAPTKSAEPEQTVRVDTKRLDAIVNLIGELVLSRNRLKTLRVRLRDEELDRAVSSLDIATSRLQSAVMRTRMQPVGKVFSRFPKVARDVARSLNKEVDLELIGADTELDRNLVEALADPLVHLVRNAIDHGIETPALREATGKPRGGHVRLSAQQEGDYVSIEVQDDGAGIDPERLRQKAREKGLIDPEAAARLTTEECLHLVFLPGFSTKAEVTDISGRGVGMDVVQSRIRELSGQIQIQSELGRGSRFLIRVPLTLAILPTLLVQAGDTVYALPLARVVEVLHAPRRALGWFDGRAVLDRQSHTLPLVDLRHWLNIEAPELPLLTVVVLQAGESRMGLVVDQVRGREEVVIKPLPRALRGLPGYAGATLIGDGRLALILDVDGLKS
ncbi:chemotaxis protein CheA [Xanthomonas translucens pv. undulosa]|uniref:chemotaxis protein CheA n=1 Tax=Xanthomonas campestris pv. translucens TaxID=343 RepID=UPI00071E77DB|nr:chemotaxis protein CheA [Xanthomonas translucens]QSQ39212.1 chemotaxis protein CheA [Xanthomonas translucens pv. translucens]QSQ40287.1 chemotaxis protein CheA [Xanthomonas translucens pv. translucens]QSQ48515.1 chemotaxis protein CheA [Xanthomonas translucens pv. undulosa]WKZ99429.1 chemotaxis protein CheA [Xanthomonas translucens]WLA03211.1 chemotaxis protein CheA [Xanthomonas translucens]